MVRTSQSFGSSLVRLFDLSLDAFCVAGFDGYLKLANPAFARILGYTQEELLARPFMDNVHPDDRESVGAILAELAAGNDVVGFQCRQVCADGSVRWFEWNTSTRPGEGLVYGVARDITDRRVANEELSALRRVATLVAESVQPRALFAVVAEEVGRLFAADATAVLRYEPDGSTVAGSWSRTGDGLGLGGGSRAAFGGQNVSTLVFETGRPARIDRYPGDDSSAITANARRFALASAVGAPINVEGRLWGALVVASTHEAGLSAGTEERLADFTELVASAIANADSREALGKLADEQATLRRMATRVAQGVPPDEIFSAVCVEVGRLVGSDRVAVARFEHGPPAIVVVGLGKSVSGIPLGTRTELDDALASTEVYRTGRSARVDARDFSSAGGPIQEAGGRLGLASTVASPIVVEGRLWGTMSVSAREPLPPGTEERLERFSELVATAMANAQSRSELAASRRRIVAASDQVRRRIERDLHDSTQQRLVTLGLAVRAAEDTVPPDRGDLRAELSCIAVGLADAAVELQELSRGIHPAILAHGGLGPALRTLARRSAVPVELDVSMDTRLPEPIEVAVYYVASEALANATKHAKAAHIEVSLATRNGRLVLSIRDDGVGGADPARGSGLIGLADRVEALGGSIQVRSVVGDGTQITAELPLELDPAAENAD